MKPRPLALLFLTLLFLGVSMTPAFGYSNANGPAPSGLSPKVTTLAHVATVPAPGAVASLLGGMVLLLGWTRRRR